MRSWKEDTEADREAFKAWLGEAHPSLDEDTTARIMRYGEFLRAETARIALVARGDLPRLYMRHIREALAIPLVSSLADGESILDIGSGGGLPGIPLAIVRPGVQFTLLESRRRKAAFLDRAGIVLGLPNCRTVMNTLEAFGKTMEDPIFDGAVSRAVAWNPRMVEALESVVRQPGRLLRFGTPDLDVPGVHVELIDPEAPRALHTWSRESWSALAPTG